VFAQSVSGMTVEKMEELEKKIKEMYHKQIIEQQESEEINMLLGPIKEEDIPKFN